MGLHASNNSLHSSNVVGLNVLTPHYKNLNKYIPKLAPGEAAHG